MWTLFWVIMACGSIALALGLLMLLVAGVAFCAEVSLLWRNDLCMDLLLAWEST